MRKKMVIVGMFLALLLLAILVAVLFQLFDISHFSFVFNSSPEEISVKNSTPQRLANPPQIIKGIYLTAYTAADSKRVDELIELIKKTELNAVVIDVKDYTGYVLFDTKSDFIKRFGTEKVIIKNLEELVKKFHDNQIYTIARITVFQDPVFAKARPDLAVKNKITGAVWKDSKGLSWIDPAAPEFWNYIFVVSKMAMRAGFDELNFDYIRFPSDGSLENMSFPFYDGHTDKNQIIKSFFEYLSKNLRPWGIKISADLFGLVTVNQGDMGIGQILEDAILYFDYICPMVYPSHYANGFIGYQNPSAYPYEVIKYSLDTAYKRFLDFKNKIFQENKGKTIQFAKLRPWLQNFDLGAVYDANMIKKEKKAVYDSLCPDEKLNENDCSFYNGWLLWDPNNLYIPQSLEIK